MDRIDKRIIVIACTLLFGGCVTVTPDQLSERSYIDSDAIVSVSRLESMISVEVTALEAPAEEAGLAAAKVTQ